MRAIGIGFCAAAIVLTGCKSVHTTEPGVVGVERSQNMLVSSSAVNSSAATSYRRIVSQAASKGQLNRDPAQLARIRGIALGMGGGAQDLTQLVLDLTFNLPNSRVDETEADRIGVELAARAAFDPRAAVTLWQKMAKLGGSQPPRFLSTHPSHATRIDDLRGYSEKVMPLYEAARAKH